MDLVRVVLSRGFNDSLGGATIVDGVSDLIPRVRAMRIAVSLGGRVLEAGEEPWPAAPPPAAPPSAAGADLAALPSEPAPDDAPGVSAAHPAPPAPSASPVRIPYTPSPLPTRDDRRSRRS